MDDVTIYRPKKSFLWAVFAIFLIVFFGLTLPRLLEGSLETRHIQALGGFYLMTLIFGLAPFLSKLEVGKDYVRAFPFGFPGNYIRASEIIVLEYGNLMRFGGLGYGKGLKIWVQTKSGSRKYYDIGELFYGKEAVDHVRRVLER